MRISFSLLVAGLTCLGALTASAAKPDKGGKGPKGGPHAEGQQPGKKDKGEQGKGNAAKAAHGKGEAVARMEEVARLHAQQGACVCQVCSEISHAAAEGRPVTPITASTIENPPVYQKPTGKPSEKGNNGLGNGVDPAPPGNPKPNDGAGTSPGSPGSRSLKSGRK